VRYFLIDTGTVTGAVPRMSCDNQVYPIDTSALASNISHIAFDIGGGVGNIEYNDRPAFGDAFSDPSVYQPFFNEWLAAGSAATPPLTLTQAIGVKAPLLMAIFNAKRATLSATAGLANWQTPKAMPPPANVGANTPFTVSGNTVSGSLNLATVTTMSAILQGTKKYWEMTVGTLGSATREPSSGILGSGQTGGANVLGNYSSGYGYAYNGTKYHAGVNTAYGSAFVTSDKIGIALDLVNHAIWFSKNGVWQGGATITDIGNGVTANAAYTGLNNAGGYYPAQSGDGSYTANWGPAYAYPAPSGFDQVGGANFDGSDRGAITLSLSISGQAAAGASSFSVPDINGNMVTLTGAQAQSVASAIQASRSNLLAAYNLNLANLNGCVDIPSVIAFDVTTGWP